MKTKIISLILLLFLFFGHTANAYNCVANDDTCDDTCTQGTGILNRIVNDITTLGLFEAYSSSFHMYGGDGTSDGQGGYNNTYYSDGSVNVDYCNADYYPANGWTGYHYSTYCQQDGTNCCDSNTVVGEAGDCANACNPKGGVKWTYDQWDPNTFAYESDPQWSTNGDSAWYFYPPGQLRVTSDGDKLCVQFSTTIGYQNIGCKYIPACDQFTLDTSCYVAASCYSFSAQESLTILPITGAIIQCVNETVAYLFTGGSACQNTDPDGANYDANSTYNVTIFPQFQANMRDAVRSALMLYIILFGLKTVLGSEAPSKVEFFNLTAKWCLVLYFSTGININMGGDTPVYSDGITTYMLPLFTTGASELANWVYSAGGSIGLCAYSDSLYADGYSYLSMWDSIDCRILYYFGLDVLGVDIDAVITLDSLGQPILLGLLLPAFFSFQLIFLVFSIVFAVMFLSVVIYFVNLSVIAIILVSILIYLAPLFVPMALFEATKGYYEGWLKVTISYALQPMVVAAYIAMMLTIFDQTMFGNCQFINNSVTAEIGGTTKTAIPFFTICDPNPGSTAPCPGTCSGSDTGSDCSSTAVIQTENVTDCSETIGWYINMQGDSFTNDIDAIFFTITTLNSNVASDMMTGLVTLCLFGYLFYKFAEVLSEFAAELTGGNAIGSAAGNPMAFFDKAASGAKDMLKGSGGSKKSGSGANSSSSKPRSGAESSKAKPKPK